MKYLKCLAFLALFGVVFGGGISTCGELTTNYVQLLHLAELRIERLLSFITYISFEYPGIVNSFLTFFDCNLNTTSYILATGLSQMSGANINYILDIFNGAVSAPFASPLDCIQNELLSYPVFVENITFNVIPQLELLSQQSPVNPNSNCSEIIQYVTLYYNAVSRIANAIIDIYSIDLTEFSSIGQQSLYLEFINDLLKCQYMSLVNSIVELTNGNLDTFLPYLMNQTETLPSPYNCIQGMIDDSNNQVGNIISTFNNSITQLTSSSSSINNCQPFLSQVEALQLVWMEYMTNLTIYAISNSLQNPILAPTYATILECEINIMIDFMANALNSLSNADPEYIYNILNGTDISPPFTTPFDCVTNNLIAMRNKIAILRSSFINQVKILAIPSTVNTDTCLSAYSGLTNYVPLLTTLINSAGPYVTNGLIEFTKIGFGDMYLDSMALMLECVPRILGTFVGTALNADSNALTAYVSGTTSRLPYPFSCVKILINIFSSLLNQAIVGFSTNQAVDLLIPSIPPYRG